MKNSHKVIYVASGTEQAHMLKDALLQQGIFAYVSNDALQVGVGDLPAGLPTAPRVVVEEQDAEEARQIALEFDAAMREAAHFEDDEDELEAEREEAARWPQCPHCNRPRHTSCPICGTAGTSFQEAYFPPQEPAAGTVATSAGHELLVLCPICDEPFAPQFPARCEWCGHRFRDGQELPAPKLPYDALEISPRAWVVFFGIVGLAAGVLALFAYVAHTPR